MTAHPLQFRVPPSLVFFIGEGVLTGYNFLTRDIFECEPELVALLAGRAGWQSDDAPGDEIAAMLDLGALTARGTPEEAREDAFLKSWEWGIPLALSHFSLHGRRYLTAEESTAKQIARAGEKASPPLFMRNGHCAAEIALPRDCADEPLIRLMAARRTVRQAKPAPVSLEALSEMLYAGMAITGFTRNRVAELPLTMTPSGGARNPYEAYVIARAVSGLAPGIYHYSALDHTLGLVSGNLPSSFAALAGGQEWVETMPCLVVLCAFMERTMWKYDDPNAYRVIMIEAGHIGQNLMLAGTRHGYTVCPTAALTHDALFDLLRLENPITQCAVYALAVGVPDEQTVA